MFSLNAYDQSISLLSQFVGSEKWKLPWDKTGKQDSSPFWTINLVKPSGMIMLWEGTENKQVFIQQDDASWDQKIPLILHFPYLFCFLYFKHYNVKYFQQTKYMSKDIMNTYVMNILLKK